MTQRPVGGYERSLALTPVGLGPLSSQKLERGQGGGAVQGTPLSRGSLDTGSHGQSKQGGKRVKHSDPRVLTGQREDAEISKLSDAHEVCRSTRVQVTRGSYVEVDHLPRLA